MLVTLRRIFGRHALARMLPDIAQRRRESDIAALGLRVGGDILHLVEEEFARVERETFLGLVAIVGIILGVGDDRDREFSVLGLRRRLRRAEHGKQHEHNMFDRHYIRLPQTPSKPPGGPPDDSQTPLNKSAGTSDMFSAKPAPPPTT